MRVIRTSTRIGLATLLVAGLALVLVSTLASRGADNDKGIVANLLSRALSTPSAGVSIGSVEGALLSDSTIHDIKISDRDGVWLQIDKVRLNWQTHRPCCCASLRSTSSKSARSRFCAARCRPNRPTPVSNEPILPELPLKMEIKDFSLKELALGEAVVGTAARISATGAASLGKPSEGLNLRFDAQRLDAAGH